MHNAVYFFGGTCIGFVGLPLAIHLLTTLLTNDDLSEDNPYHPYRIDTGLQMFALGYLVTELFRQVYPDPDPNSSAPNRPVINRSRRIALLLGLLFGFIGLPLLLMTWILFGSVFLVLCLLLITASLFVGRFLLCVPSVAK